MEDGSGLLLSARQNSKAAGLPSAMACEIDGASAFISTAIAAIQIHSAWCFHLFANLICMVRNYTCSSAPPLRALPPTPAPPSSAAPARDARTVRNWARDWRAPASGNSAPAWVPASPRATNKILRAYLKSKGVADKDIDEKYTPFGHSDYQTIVADVKKFSAGGKTAVVSTINGDSNVPFYKELGNAGLKAKDVPVVAFSVGEEELRGVDTKPLVGHLAAWNYFMSIKNPANDEFTKKWAAYAKAKNIPGHKDKPLTNDPMEATYIGINMWKQAVEKAKTTDTDKVIAAMAGQTFKAPSGITSKMDEKNHHLHKSVFIGEIKADGQFNVVWKTPGPVKAKPWSPYIPGNDVKPDEPVKK
eukprot:gene23293-26367_t